MPSGVCAVFFQVSSKTRAVCLHASSPLFSFMAFWNEHSLLWQIRLVWDSTMSESKMKSSRAFGRTQVMIEAQVVLKSKPPTKRGWASKSKWAAVRHETNPLKSWWLAIKKECRDSNFEVGSGSLPEISWSTNAQSLNPLFCNHAQGSNSSKGALKSPTMMAGPRNCAALSAACTNNLFVKEVKCCVCCACAEQVPATP